MPEEPKQPEAPPVQKVAVSKPFVEEKPKQEEKEEIDIEKIMAELDNHKLEYHDIASGYKPKIYPPKIAAEIRKRIKAKKQLKKEEEEK